MKIMVALDGSEFAEAVLEPAAQLAEAAGAHVFLVQVVAPSRVHSTWPDAPEYYEETGRDAYTVMGERITRATYTVDQPSAVESYDQARARAVQTANTTLSIPEGA